VGTNREPVAEGPYCLTVWPFSITGLAAGFHIVSGARPARPFFPPFKEPPRGHK
jgi:hypothetical protein